MYELVTKGYPICQECKIGILRNRRLTPRGMVYICNMCCSEFKRIKVDLGFAKCGD